MCVPIDEKQKIGEFQVCFVVQGHQLDVYWCFRALQVCNFLTQIIDINVFVVGIVVKIR